MIIHKSVGSVPAPRLLITMSWGIGDAIDIGLSAVDQITRNDPEGRATIDMLCNYRQAPLFEHDSRIHEIIAIEHQLLPTAEQGTWKRGLFLPKETRQLVTSLRNRKYTATLPVFFGPGFFYHLHTPVLLPDMQRLRQAIKRLRFFEDVSLQQLIRHTINRGFGGQLPEAEVDEPIPLYLSTEHLQHARQQMARRKTLAGLPHNHHPWLLVAPDTSSHITRPPTELLAQGIAGALQAQANLFVDILPGYTDTQAASRLWHALTPHFPGRVFLMPAEPQMHLLELAAFIDQSDIFLTGDTSTMHLAAAIKTLAPSARSNVCPRNANAIIALFGGTHPGLHGYSKRTTIIGKGRKDQFAFAPGIIKETYHARTMNFFDHISPRQLTDAILAQHMVSKPLFAPLHTPV